MLELIARRRSVRKYLPDMPEREKIEAVLKAGQQAPSGGNCQLNHFIVVTNPDVKQKLVETVAAAFAGMTYDENTYASIRSAIQRAKEGGYVYDYNAPVLVIVANKISHGNAMADAAVAIENMMLAAASLELGSCWINQLRWLRDEPAVRELLESIGLAGDETVCGAMSLGIPVHAPAAAPKLTGNRITWVE